MIDVGLTAEQRVRLVQHIADHLHEHTAKIYDDGHRKHLGASVIGDDCWRKLWYGFRWVKKATFKDAKGKDIKGRMLRLFNRGHKEEFRFVEWLRGMGFTVEEFEPSSRLYHCSGEYMVYAADQIVSAGWDDVTGNQEHQERAAGKGVKRKQLRISDCFGHYGGSLDGLVDFPASYGALPRVLAEFKTSGDKYFGKLVDNGVKFAKPEHFAQMCSYGKRYNMHYCLYMCVNKNTDDIHIELVELDDNHSDEMTVKASRIIFSQEIPPRLSDNSAFWKCKTCQFNGVCFKGEPFDKNCRSCRHASPIADGKWACALFTQQYGPIPEHTIPVGCEHWIENK